MGIAQPGDESKQSMSKKATRKNLSGEHSNRSTQEKSVTFAEQFHTEGTNKGTKLGLESSREGSRMVIMKKGCF